MIEIDGYQLVLTCGACPEQYDVFRGEEKVGYLRLRHGYFRADVPECAGEMVYDASTEGDGIFTDDERIPQLRAAIAAIDHHRLTDALNKAQDRWFGPD